MSFYKEEDREIFKFKLGGRDRYGDPIAIMARYNEIVATSMVDTDNAYELIDGTSSGNSGGLSEEEKEKQKNISFAIGVVKLAPLAAYALNVELLNEETGEGFASLSVVEAFLSFINWQADVKKDSGETQNGSPPTDGLQEDSEQEPQPPVFKPVPPQEVRSPMNNSVVSGSTGRGRRQFRQSR